MLNSSAGVEEAILHWSAQNFWKLLNVWKKAATYRLVIAILYKKQNNTRGSGPQMKNR